jgi:hypothetical protein
MRMKGFRINALWKLESFEPLIGAGFLSPLLPETFFHVQA